MAIIDDKSIIIYADGSDLKEIHPPFTLEYLQGIVGGLIEVVRLKGYDDIMLVNEEGMNSNLPINITASAVYQKYTNSNQPIFGNAIITQRKHLN